MVAFPASPKTVTVRTVDTQIGVSPRTEIGRLAITWECSNSASRIFYTAMASYVRVVARGVKNRLLLNSTVTDVAERWGQGFSDIAKEKFGAETLPMMEPFVWIIGVELLVT